MRPLRLDLEGFTVFRELTTVDFTDADFFALIGPTGSGKSTILDAICFALYGTVPRWNDRRAVANALPPSGAQARVRLVFESAGSRYAATRVVRRDGKGRVTTSQAGLELLPKGFDLSILDKDPAAGDPLDLGEPLAGTPAEMEQAVLNAIGLPYEQFTSCLVLPQGAFAEFLHAKPAQRQQILVNLLGLSVYEEIRNRATSLATEADARLGAADRLLADLADATDEALAQAAARADEMRALAVEVSAAVPVLLVAQRDAQAARRALADLDGELDRLSEVRAPAEAGDIAAAGSTADAAVAEAAEAVSAAEEHEERLRTELSGAGDVATMHRLLDQFAERDRIAVQGGDFASAVGQAEAEYEEAVRALDLATEAAGDASARLSVAEHAVEQARTADRAASLRPHLRVGHACPVCTQQVTELPAMPEAPALRAASARLVEAQQAAESAGAVKVSRERALRDLDKALSRVRAERDALNRQLVTLDTRLAGVEPAVLRAGLDTVGRLQRDLDTAGGRVRTARDAHRKATAQASRARQRLAAAWREFDGVRDAVAPLAPPPADRDDLAAAWRTLSGWARTEWNDRRTRRTELAATQETAQAAALAATGRIAELFTGAGLPEPTGPVQPTGPDFDGGVDFDGRGGPAEAAAIAVERAEAAHARLVERREQTDRLAQQRAGHERDSQLARALANHLRANNFERWLLEEALDRLVEGASRILRDLSSGQYELVHDKGEFFVIDQHDAALRRGVRTLSGGETFQASLALALALSEQLTGMSTGAASLESILLDEGFGTLDASTLDTVAATLENLAARGERMVGVVTHVSALAERVPVRFEVRKDARTARVERVQG
ncbi:MAG TPA: SMC family ATPase [Rugosimonospora sp.]